MKKCLIGSNDIKMRFDDFFESDDLLDALWDMHFEEMTPIQEQAIPAVLQGNDLLACAQTGTGKTAAYLLPVIDLLCTEDFPKDSVNCVIMAPTRELAQQIDRQMQGFSYFLPISSLPIYGGTDGHTYEQQRKGLKMGADVVIATPGRLIAHLQMGSVDLSKVSFFILDEADRMLDMGFYEDIMNIVKHLPTQRQTLLFSATMPPKIQKLANTILHNPHEIKLSVSKPADKIDQVAYYCSELQKDEVLKHVIEKEDVKRVIVFAASKLKVKQLARSLKIANLKIGEMHSDLDQNKREDVMLDFKSGKINVLIATDIVARGIDVDDIEMVVNYDVPREGEDYVHRVGRTARADRDGMGVTLVSDRDRQSFRNIERLLGKSVRKGDLPESIAPKSEEPTHKENKGNHSRNNKKDNKRRPYDNKHKDAQKISNVAKGVVNTTSNESKSEEKPKRRNNYHHRRKGTHQKSKVPNPTKQNASE